MAIQGRKGLGISESNLGVHIENGRAIRWKIENSWGPQYRCEGNLSLFSRKGLILAGYLCFEDKWFDECVYGIAVDRSLLTDEELTLINIDPVILDPSDPFTKL